MNRKGLFEFKCKSTGISYVGTTLVSFTYARYTLINSLKSRTTIINTKLKNDFAKYGIENFEFNILKSFTLVSFDELLQVKCEHMSEMGLGNLYNRTMQANRKSSMLGRKCKSSTKMKMSEWVRTSTYRANLSNLKKVWHSENDSPVSVGLKCIETGEVYKSITQASKLIYGFGKSSKPKIYKILKSINQKIAVDGYTWERLK